MITLKIFSERLIAIDLTLGDLVNFLIDLEQVGPIICASAQFSPEFQCPVLTIIFGAEEIGETATEIINKYKKHYKAFFNIDGLFCNLENGDLRIRLPLFEFHETSSEGHHVYTPILASLLKIFFPTNPMCILTYNKTSLNNDDSKNKMIYNIQKVYIQHVQQNRDLYNKSKIILDDFEKDLELCFPEFSRDFVTPLYIEYRKEKSHRYFDLLPPEVLNIALTFFNQRATALLKPFFSYTSKQKIAILRAILNLLPQTDISYELESIGNCFIVNDSSKNNAALLQVLNDLDGKKIIRYEVTKFQKPLLSFTSHPPRKNKVHDVIAITYCDLVNLKKHSEEHCVDDDKFYVHERHEEDLPELTLV